jgi:hypothetical protein
MYNRKKLLSRFLYSLSIAIGCGLAAINPSCAHAFPENFIVTLGQYTVFESGVSDQVPVSVKLKWPGHADNAITIFYSAYSGGAQYWGTDASKSSRFWRSTTTITALPPPHLSRSPRRSYLDRSTLGRT